MDAYTYYQISLKECRNYSFLFYNVLGIGKSLHQIAEMFVKSGDMFVEEDNRNGAISAYVDSICVYCRIKIFNNSGKCNDEQYLTYIFRILNNLDEYNILENTTDKILECYEKITLMLLTSSFYKKYCIFEELHINLELFRKINSNICNYYINKYSDKLSSQILKEIENLLKSEYRIIKYNLIFISDLISDDFKNYILKLISVFKD